MHYQTLTCTFFTIDAFFPFFCPCFRFLMYIWIPLAALPLEASFLGDVLLATRPPKFLVTFGDGWTQSNFLGEDRLSTSFGGALFPADIFLLSTFPPGDLSLNVTLISPLTPDICPDDNCTLDSAVAAGLLESCLLGRDGFNACVFSAVEGVLDVEEIVLEFATLFFFCKSELLFTAGRSLTESKGFPMRSRCSSSKDLLRTAGSTPASMSRSRSSLRSKGDRYLVGCWPW